MNGITIHDRENKSKPIVSQKKIGRNEIITIQKDGEEKVLKYKKAQRFLNDGWIIK